MNAIDRTRVFQLRVTDEERAMVRALADAQGLTASDIVRQYIRNGYRERFGDKPAIEPKAIPKRTTARK